MRVALCLMALPLAAAFAQPQNPSPMVEHSRTHPRFTRQDPAGTRLNLELGMLFVPERPAEKAREPLPLIFFFHGGEWLPVMAADQNGMAVVTIQTNAGSSTYAAMFNDPKRFIALVDEAQQKTGIKFSRVLAGGWSAGCSAIRQILKSPEAYARIDSALMVDGIHTDYPFGRPGPQESNIGKENLEIWLQLGRDAMAGKKGRDHHPLGNLPRHFRKHHRDC